MKKNMLFIGALLFLCSTPAEAQFLKKLTKKLEKKIDNTGKKLEEKVDQKIDKVLDLDQDQETSYPDQMESPQESDTQMGDAQHENIEEHIFSEGDTTIEGTDSVSFASYSAYDFTPGTTLVAYEDFASEAVGDFPSKWNTNASAEVVSLTTEEGKWLRIGQGKGTFTFSEIPTPLPEDFSLEFDLLFDFEASSYAFKRYFNVLLSNLDNPDMYLSDFSPSKEYVSISFTNGSGSGRYVGLHRATAQKGMELRSKKVHPFFSKEGVKGSIAHIAMLKKGSRLKVYINASKVLDIPKAFLKETSMQSLRFQSEISPNEQHFFVGNLKFATGVTLPANVFDTGSYQAHGIQFESGSAQLNPASYGTLKKVAQAIEAYPGSSFEIVGHTDSDGDDSINIPLSQKRAAAVEQTLINTFNIDPSALQTAGKGSSEPLSYEMSTTGKAQNRRVEIKKI
jgi:outer membrane protein OmpA-like peptidoglycan-associated protein